MGIQYRPRKAGRIMRAITAGVAVVLLANAVDASPRSLRTPDLDRKSKDRVVREAVCLVDEDCNDNNACTHDVCFDAVCINKSIPGCETNCSIDDDCNDNMLCTTDLCVEQVCQNNAIPECCEIDEDCDDQDPCTNEICVSNVCERTTIEDCVPCITQAACPAIETVILFDTSGSMVDEGHVICNQLQTLIDDLGNNGIPVIPHYLGISEIPPFGFDCIEASVIELLGTAVPGDGGNCLFPDGSAPQESWGPATAIVAELFPWQEGTRRLIIPLSNEGPCNGSIPEGCGDPGDDRDAINNAIATATINGVVVSPIAATGYDSCSTALGNDIAAATSGHAMSIEVSETDLVVAMSEILGDACQLGGACEDGNECTDDVCNENGVCENQPNHDAETECCNPEDGNLTAIDDGNACTDDLCDLLDGSVSHDPAQEGTTCDDGDPCTESDACDGNGSCSGTGIDCDDQNACTDDSCVDGTCVNAPNYTVDIECCNPADGSTSVIDDGDNCTNDVCNDMTGTVGHPPADVGTPCDDGDNCTENDVCNSQGACEGSGRECNDNIDCTNDSCDEITGQCMHTPDDTACDNGLFCDGVETCNPTSGLAAGTPVNCNDNVDCTVDQCDENTDACTNTPDDNQCNNELFCDGVETCDPSLGCVPGTEPDCDDGVDCTVDNCERIGDFCRHVPDDALCNNGQFCDGIEACDPLRGCVEGVEPDCDDGIECTLDMCDENGDECIHTPLDQLCDNGNFCDGAEACNPQTGCEQGTVRNCDDNNACTTDSCDPTLDECVNSAGHDPQTFCCNPEDGSLNGIDDGNSCTDDLCDHLSGAVTHPPSEEGTPCDDAAECSHTDSCNGEGLCLGDNINGLPCESDEDCFGTICDNNTGTCLCARDLCLDVVEDRACGLVEDQLQVNIHVNFGPQFVAGGQFVIPYDPTQLAFVDLIPGSQVDPASPFSMEIFEDVDENEGLIVYSVGIVPGLPASRGPDIMGAIIFQPLAPCSMAELCFISENPLNTLLTDDHGARVPFETCCTGTIVFNDGPPVVNCPTSSAVNPDPGSLNAVVEWDPLNATDGCDETTELNCAATHDQGFDIDNLIEAGGVFPVGLSQFECVSTDSCGATTTCEWFVDVSDDNTVDVSVQLSPTVMPGPLTRCIEFELFTSCVEPPQVISENLNFGLPFDLPGRAKNIPLKVPSGQYFCMTARDPLHTIRATALLDQVDGIYTAQFKGDPQVGGNWLIGGNLNGDHVIDLMDAMIFMENEFSEEDPHTVCDVTGPHADINGDGIVDQMDYSFLQANYLAEDKQTCCPEGTASAPAMVTEISTKQLQLMGLSHLTIADLNDDGMVNDDDLDLYHGGVRPVRSLPKGQE